ncbi:MAG: helix-turn-helix transcriptional regulator [Candidatus Micrarchaeota archaeon]|nr:helix-turn-helix transcriptional regulator [Candidatus Micrarchaeota archaeon]
MKNKVRELRAHWKMTQEDLAKAAGVSRQTIIAIESEKYDPSLPLAFKISKVFKMKIEEIFVFE